MKFILFITFLIAVKASSGQPYTDSIRLNFLYGSVPAEGFKKTEPKYFGGLKGGHVNIELDGRVLDFTPKGKCPIIPDNVNPQGGFTINERVHWDTATSKWISITIPVTEWQFKKLDTLFEGYAASSPYDYAVFGMRCAAASYDVLSEIGLFRKMSLKNNIVTNFYPKLLRKRMIRWAREHHYPVEFHTGRSSRKWETDEGLF